MIRREDVPGLIEIVEREVAFLIKFGGDLLSHVLRRSTIGVPALNGRVRDGIGCFAGTMTTKLVKKRVRFLTTPAKAGAPMILVDHLSCQLTHYISVVPSLLVCF